MMNEAQLGRLIDRIKALGFDEATAAGFATLIGDTPLLDSQGRIVVRDEHGRELARIELP